jgi:hypothetical protein
MVLELENAVIGSEVENCKCKRYDITLLAMQVKRLRRKGGFQG